MIREDHVSGNVKETEAGFAANQRGRATQFPRALSFTLFLTSLHELNVCSFCAQAFAVYDQARKEIMKYGRDHGD